MNSHSSNTEQAVLQLYKLYDLETVNDDAWIPQTGIESTQTNGRKSTKSQQAKKRKAMEYEELTLEEVTEVRQTTNRSARIAKKQSNKVKKLEEEQPLQKISTHQPRRTKVKDELLSVELPPRALPEREQVPRKSRKKAVEQNNDASFEMENGSTDDVPDVKKKNKNVNSTTSVNGKSRRGARTRKITGD